MKKFLFSLALMAVAALSVNAQIMRAEELEEYAETLYGKKWVDIAANLKAESTLTLDKNNSLTYVQIIEAPERTALQLYTTLNYWFTSTFNDANSTIKLNDKEAGCIIAQGSVEGIATHTGGANQYNVLKVVGGGIMGQINQGLNGKNETKDVYETWPLDQTYPFAEKDAFKAKKTSSKAIIMTYCYSQVMLDKIEEAIKNGMVNEDDNW